MVADPTALVVGAKIKLPVELGLEYLTVGGGISAGLLEVAETVSAKV